MKLRQKLAPYNNIINIPEENSVASRIYVARTIKPNSTYPISSLTFSQSPFSSLTGEHQTHLLSGTHHQPYNVHNRPTLVNSHHSQESNKFLIIPASSTSNQLSTPLVEVTYLLPELTSPAGRSRAHFNDSFVQPCSRPALSPRNL